MSPRAVVVCQRADAFDVVVGDLIHPGFVVATVRSVDEANEICRSLAWSYRVRALPMFQKDGDER